MPPQPANRRTSPPQPDASKSNEAGNHSKASAVTTTGDHLGTLAKLNNSWYAGEPGEKSAVLRSGSIRPDQPRSRPAWEHSDAYTKSRNPANDQKRYSYIDDCTNAIRRDVMMRFSLPSIVRKDPKTFTVLPPIKYAAPTSPCGAPIKRAVMGGAACPVKASVFKAGNRCVVGVSDPQRFRVISPTIHPR